MTHIGELNSVVTDDLRFFQKGHSVQISVYYRDCSYWWYWYQDKVAYRQTLTMRLIYHMPFRGRGSHIKRNICGRALQEREIFYVAPETIKMDDGIAIQTFVVLLRCPCICVWIKCYQHHQAATSVTYLGDGGYKSERLLTCQYGKIFACRTARYILIDSLIFCLITKSFLTYSFFFSPTPALINPMWALMLNWFIFAPGRRVLTWAALSVCFPAFILRLSCRFTHLQLADLYLSDILLGLMINPSVIE